MLASVLAAYGWNVCRCCALEKRWCDVYEKTFDVVLMMTILTEIVNMSVQVPPVVSTVLVVPCMVKESKSSRMSHTSVDKNSITLLQMLAIEMMETMNAINRSLLTWGALCYGVTDGRARAVRTRVVGVPYVGAVLGH